ncbi:MAG: phosphatidylserine decarboxylase [Hydrogenophaga sp.]|uniref:phosphatidylserine decarboxylase n=1 Tax=Hydrogenophaga sp. TaxID=1904254 RepID=UPI003D0F238A
MSWTLALQILIVATCVAVLLDYARRFPFPSRLVAPFLPPMKRWPVPQLWKWVEDGSPDPGFLNFFMRDPDRKIPPGKDWIAPVDGTVLAKLTRDGRNFLVISLNVWDVHVGRMPFAGTVTGYVEHGDILESDRSDPLRDEPYYFLRGKRSPKQRYMEAQTEFGLARIRFVTSYLSRRIEFFHPVGAELPKGERMGRMLFGSTCVIEVDARYAFDIPEGVRTVAGETIILRNPAKNAP